MVVMLLRLVRLQKLGVSLCCMDTTMPKGKRKCIRMSTNMRMSMAKSP